MQRGRSQSKERRLRCLVDCSCAFLEDALISQIRVTVSISPSARAPGGTATPPTHALRKSDTQLSEASFATSRLSACRARDSPASARAREIFTYIFGVYRFLPHSRYVVNRRPGNFSRQEHRARADLDSALVSASFVLNEIGRSADLRRNRPFRENMQWILLYLSSLFDQHDHRFVNCIRARRVYS